MRSLTTLHSVVSILVVVATLAGCGRRDRSSPEEASRRVVVVVSVDSLRSSRLGSYGYSPPTTPSLDRFADQAFRFGDAYSTTSWTKPAMASLFLGRSVHEHLTFLSLRRVGEALSAMPGLTWSAERREATLGRAMVVPGHLEPFHARLEGFRKGAFLNNPHLAGEFGFDRSWDVYRHYPPKMAGRKGEDSRAPEINRDALRFVDSHPRDDLYLWLHYNDVHYPYGPVRGQHRLFRGDLRRADFRHHPRPSHFSLVRKAEGDPGARRLLSALYDAGLRTFDARLGELLDGLRQRGILDGALVFVTADHGEEFWEHGAFGHGKNLFAPTSRIPLLMKVPGQDTGQFVEGPVSLIDVAPTVLDFCGASPDPSLRGQSLLTVVRAGRPLDRSVVIELVREGYEVALVRSGWKLRLGFGLPGLVAHLEDDREPEAALEPDFVELYDLTEDPEEQHPLDLAANAERVARMEAELLAALGGRLNILAKLEDEWESTPGVSYPELLKRQEDPRYRELEEQLRALGYL